MYRRVVRSAAALVGAAASLPLLAAPVPAGADAAPPPEWEYKAVPFGADEKDATKRLNDLSRAGWEYVGPLAHNLVAFRRPDPLYRQKVARLELSKWQGEWECGGWTLTIKGDRWSWVKTGEKPPLLDEIRIVEVRADMTLADLLVRDPDNFKKGQTVKAIFRLDGAALHYCGTYGPTRPTEFRSVNDNECYVWKRSGKDK